MATIALNFEDGVTRVIESRSGETLADAAFRVGINIPLDCNEGVCGTCKCKWKSGQFEMGDYIDDALTEEEVAEGFSLACQMTPTSETVVDILASSKACKVKAVTHATTILSIDFKSSEIVKLVVKLQKGEKLHFLQGQYANIEIPNTGLHRSYSFSRDSGGDELEFIIKLVPNGLMSDFLRDKAKVGSILNLKGPTGSFYLRDLHHPTLFFAGGTGIAPFLAMLEKLAKHKVKQPIQLFYGANAEEHLVELERLNAFKKTMPFEYHTVSVAPTPNHAQGFVNQWITKDILKAKEYDIYICGPNVMVESVKASLAKAGIKIANFYLEKFVPSGV
jgi:benzoate/toluate 1,2-dioxygenase reductase component